MNPGYNQNHGLQKLLVIQKKILKKGEKIDGIGGFATYGVTYPVANTDNLIPLGLLEGATVIKDLKKGEPITKDSVELPENLINSLRKLQEAS